MTPRESETLSVIKNYWATHDYSPSYIDIMSELGLKSKSSVNRLVCGLQAKGHITHGYGQQRSIKVVEKFCPHCGRNLE